MESRLGEITAGLRRLREAKAERARLEDRASKLAEEINALEHSQLPDLFFTAGISSLSIPASGDLPATEAVLEPYYKASIPVSWPPERRADAYSYLESVGGGDLIKSQVTVTLGRDSEAERRLVTLALDEIGVPYTVSLSVPWASLTAFYRESVERGDLLDAERIGARLGSAVRVKEV